MRLFHKGKDGGPDSTVTGFWLVELKRLFSVALLRFDDGSRDAYHSHAFDCISWVLKGCLIENHMNGTRDIHFPHWLPVITRRSTFHKVVSKGTTWVLTIRGPWDKTWLEYDPHTRKYTNLEDGRTVVSSYR